MPAGTNNGKPVAITVKRHSKICLMCLHCSDQGAQAVLVTGIWRTIGESAVQFAIQGHHFTAQLFEQLRCNPAGGTVACVDNHLERNGNGDVADDLLDISGHNVLTDHSASALLEFASDDALANVLNTPGCNSLLLNDYF